VVAGGHRGGDIGGNNRATLGANAGHGGGRLRCITRAN